MENKEQAANKWFEDNGWNIYNHYDTRPAFISGALWQSSQPINSGWVSVETPPELDTTVWIFCDGFVTIAYYWMYCDEPAYHSGDERFYPTHWMLLSKPQPPKQ
jgi:hypothetical protein